MNYETLKAAVANVIKTNGNEEITGQLLQDVLIAIINALGSGYQFMGIATAETTPGTPDQRVFYLAGSAGSTVLPGFGITVDHEICVLMYSDEWEKQTLLQFDSALTSGSQKLVTSGMVYNAVTNLSQAINGLAQTVGEHTTAIESLQGTVGGHTTAINNLQYAVVAIQAAIESLQTDVAQKIDKSDADSLVVGSAQGILATSAVEAFFLFQQSGATGNGAALIPTIKGKTIAWNQLIPNGNFATNSGWAAQNATFAIANNACKFTVSARFGGIRTGNLVNKVSGHKYLILFDLSTASAYGNIVCDWGANNVRVIESAQSGRRVGRAILNSTATESSFFWVHDYNDSNWQEITIYGVMSIDLTFMFGAGNEPSSVAEFEALYPLLYYAYILGVLKNNDAVAMITNGFNQWDEVAEPGGINSSDGQNSASTTTGRSKNYIPVFGGTTYYAKTTQRMYTRYYDASQNYLGYLSKDNKGSVLNEEFTTPDNCAYMRFMCDTIIAANSICINFSNPTKNGTYEPYWTRTSNFGLTGITGIPEGGTEADRVTMFPNGLGGAGSAFDSLFVENGVTKARKTMARVAIPDLSWTNYQSGRYSAPLSPAPVPPATTSTKPNNISDKYTVLAGTVATGQVGQMWFSGSNVYVGDNSTPSAGSIEYELATPIVYTDLQYADGTPFIMPQMFRTAQGGTMLIVSPEGATEPSAPFSADIIYPVDPIASSGASLKNLLEALKTATVITSYTMTFNSTTQQYEFTITK